MADRGRPRGFDREAALRQAMELFWEHGYEGTSVSDLTHAMGISAPSLYAAFECKEALFRDAIALYLKTSGSATGRALESTSSARDTVEAMLRGNAELAGKPEHPDGCMMVLSAINYNAKNGEIRDYLVERRRATVAAIEERLRNSRERGELPPDADVEAVAAFYATVLHGMAIEARDGVSRERLHSIVDTAMAAWEALVGPTVLA